MRLCSQLILAQVFFTARVMAAGGEAWYHYDHERDFVELLILMVLIVLALLFDHWWHWFRHTAEGSYRYGDFHNQAAAIHDSHEQDGHGNYRHLQLQRQLVSRAAGEFMTLGFLAFVTFFINQCGGFKAISKAIPSTSIPNFHLPNTPSDWLHMVETVHMKLFMGMICYFLLMSSVIRGSVSMIQKWEQLRIRHLKDRLTGTHYQDSELQNYHLWRDYFIRKVCGWKFSHPALYAKVVYTLDIDPDTPDLEEVVRMNIDGRFALSAYLAHNVEAGVLDSLEVHEVTWISILCAFGVLSLLVRYAHFTLLLFTPFLVGVATIVLLGMECLVQHRVRKIRFFTKFGKAKTGSSDSPGGFGNRASAVEANYATNPYKTKRYSKRQWVSLRLLQIVLFFLSYLFARTSGDVHEWTAEFQWTLLITLALALLFAILTHFLPTQVPLFLAVMALPPFVDNMHLEFFLRTMLDDHMAPEEVAQVEYEISLSTPAARSGKNFDMINTDSMSKKSSQGSSHGKLEMLQEDCDVRPTIEIPPTPSLAKTPRRSRNQKSPWTPTMMADFTRRLDAVEHTPKEVELLKSHLRVLADRVRRIEKSTIGENNAVEIEV